MLENILVLFSGWLGMWCFDWLVGVFMLLLVLGVEFVCEMFGCRIGVGFFLEECCSIEFSCSSFKNVRCL